MTIIGIDPGLTGAIAVLHEDGTVRTVADMPTIADGTAKGAMLDYHELRPLLSSLGAVHAYVEHQQVFPHDGKVGAFRLGRCYEGLLAALAMREVPYTAVRPLTWKDAFGLRGKEKEAARALAQRWYPAVKLGAKTAGRADALLIARYGWLEMTRR